MKIKKFEKFSYDGELFYYFDNEDNENHWSTNFNLLQSYIISLQDRINETTKYVSELSNKGRGCEIYEDIKKEILQLLKR